MGVYNSDWFSFSVKSRRHILDLTINPSFAVAVCFQVHEMAEDSFQLFWNYEMRPVREQWKLIKKYVDINKDKLDMKMSLADLYFSAELAAFMRLHTPPISIADLDAGDMASVNAVINANWQDKEYRGGLDGHNYRIKIYGEQVREFRCWCDIPAEWSELIPLVDRLIEVAKLKPRDCYAVHGVY